MGEGLLCHLHGGLPVLLEDARGSGAFPWFFWRLDWKGMSMVVDEYTALAALGGLLCINLVGYAVGQSDD
jgi:hypothetical protein